MRYGSFRYGSGERYGVSTVERQLWALMVDWNGDGVYEYYNEAVYMMDLKITRGRKNLINSARSGFEPVGIGRMTVDLDNTDGRFDPFNTRSPLYPYVRPGVKIAVLTKLTAGDIYPVFAGQIEDIVPISGSSKRVRLVAVDGLAWLADQDVEIFPTAGIAIDEAVALVLAAAQWPWGSQLEASTTNLAWFWSTSGKSARQLLDELAGVDMGNFFVAADGAARYYSRQHGLGAGTVRFEQEDLSGEVLVRSPWGTVVNSVTLNCHQWAAENTAVVWSLSTITEIAAGGTFEIYGVFQNAPVGVYITPVAGTDYVVNTAPDGSGTNITTSCTLSLTVYATGVQMRLTNGSAHAGYITLLQLRGQVLTDNPVRVQRSDAASQTLYGPKTLTVESAFAQDTNLAGAIAEALIDQLAAAQVFPTVTLVNRPEIQYGLELFDFVDLIIEQIGLTATYRLAYIEHRWLAENGQVTETVLSFEPVSILPDVVWRFPTQIGIESKFAF